MKFTAIKAGWKRRLGLAASLLTLVLAGCGGGTEIEPFSPNRILSFGDEMNVINQNGTINGTKYTVNDFVPATTTDPIVAAHIDCTVNPLWIQSVASHYGMAFDKCPGTSTTQAGRIYAAEGAKSADLDTQVATALSTLGTGFTDKDLVTVMVGMNDVLAAYDQYPSTTEADLESALTDKGKQLAAKVNNIAMQGPAVIVATVPDLGLTPYALLQEKATAGRAALLTRLTDAFNKGLRTNLINDGHLVGLVSADLEVQRMVQLPTYYGLLNVNQPVCLDAYNSSTGRDDLSLLQACTTDASKLVKDVDNNGAKLVDNTGSSSAATATPSYYLWAGNLMLSAHGQAQIGSLAVSRADGNPF